MCTLVQWFHNLESCWTIQTGGYFIHEKSFHRSYRVPAFPLFSHYQFVRLGWKTSVSVLSRSNETSRCRLYYYQIFKVKYDLPIVTRFFCPQHCRSILPQYLRHSPVPKSENVKQIKSLFLPFVDLCPLSACDVGTATINYFSTTCDEFSFVHTLRNLNFCLFLL